MGELARWRWVVLCLLIAVALVSSLVALLSGSHWWDALLSFGTEVAGAILTYALFELIIERRERRQAREVEIRARKAELVSQMGSKVRDVSIPATEELQGRGWLQDGSLRGAVLERANLQGAILRGADLQGADLLGANLQRAYLWEANLRDVKLGGAKLQRAILRDADLQGAYLLGASLQEADLRGADLQGANLWGANLQEANLWGANLQGAMLRGANLQGAKLWEANLQEADLRSANLPGARLRGANLQEAVLRGASLQGAHLWGTNLQGAKLEEADLQGIRYNNATIWPDGFAPPPEAVNVDAETEKPPMDSSVSTETEELQAEQGSIEAEAELPQRGDDQSLEYLESSVD